MKGLYNGDFAALEKEAIIRKKDFKYIEQNPKCCYLCEHVYIVDYTEIYGAKVNQFSICKKFEEG